MRRFRSARDIANSGGRLDVSGIVVGVVPELPHQELVDRFRVHREDIGKRLVNRMADRAFLVRFGSLIRRTPQRPAQLRPYSAFIVGAQASYMHVCTIASARAAIGAPIFASRTPCTATLVHRTTTSGSKDKLLLTDSGESWLDNRTASATTRTLVNNGAKIDMLDILSGVKSQSAPPCGRFIEFRANFVLRSLRCANIGVAGHRPAWTPTTACEDIGLPDEHVGPRAYNGRR